VTLAGDNLHRYAASSPGAFDRVEHGAAIATAAPTVFGGLVLLPPPKMRAVVQQGFGDLLLAATSVDTAAHDFGDGRAIRFWERNYGHICLQKKADWKFPRRTVK
jgi:hypothetical protein